ncbi:MAG: hypothetical protein ABIS86_16815 [Streptosporangiaceae bacterium]
MKPPFAPAVLCLALTACGGLTACSGEKDPHAASSSSSAATAQETAQPDECGTSAGTALPADMRRDPGEFSLEVRDLVGGRITVDQAIQYSMLSQFKGTGPKVPARYAHPAHGADVIYSATLLFPWASPEICTWAQAIMSSP